VKVRVRFTKLGKVRFTSHRDVARVWERAIRRADLPVAYSQGFTPRPRLSFGLALSTGYESLAEYLDLDLDAPAGEVDLGRMPGVLTDSLPVGFAVTAVAVVEPGTDSLQQAVTSCSWDLVLRDIDRATVETLVDAVLAADHIPVTRERKGKPVDDDLRPGVLALTVVGDSDDVEHPGVLLRAELGTQPRGLRPSELLEAMGIGDHEGLVRRTHQWTASGPERREPLAADAEARRAPADGDARREDDHHVRPTGHPDPDPACGVDADAPDAPDADASDPGTDVALVDARG
jgi:radical SAM-linked protein